MGYFRTKHLAASWGYDIVSDCRFSLRVGIEQRHRDGEPGYILYRLFFGFYCDWPKLAWAHEAWAVDEPGYLRGMPVARQGVKSSTWTGREWHLLGIQWCRGWSFNRYG